LIGGGLILLEVSDYAGCCWFRFVLASLLGGGGRHILCRVILVVGIGAGDENQAQHADNKENLPKRVATA
jgi:hypothetical protein